jgi:hypothetical protein
MRVSRRSVFYSAEFVNAIKTLSVTIDEPDLEQQVMGNGCGLTMKTAREIVKYHPSLHRKLVDEARANKGRLLPRQFRDVDRAIEAARVAINNVARRWPDKCNDCTLADVLRHFAGKMEAAK